MRLKHVITLKCTHWEVNNAVLLAYLKISWTLSARLLLIAAAVQPLSIQFIFCLSRLISPQPLLNFHPKTHEPSITRTWTKERSSRRRCAAWLPPYCWDKRSTGTICNASMSTGLNIIKFLKVKRSQLLGPVSGLHDYIRILDFPA